MSYSSDTSELFVSEETRLAFHQLCMQQIELEKQNEELRQANWKLDSALTRYFELYEQAPVGCCSLSDTGVILDGNHTAASLLGLARDALINHPFSLFIHQDDQNVFSRHCNQMFTTCAGANGCELRMVKRDGTVFWAHLTTAASQRAGDKAVCNLVITDISDQAGESGRQVFPAFELGEKYFSGGCSG